MSERRITIKDVAARAGVSIATVSNVFTNAKPVNPDLRKRVESAAAALGYRLDRAASQLRSGQTRVVGILVPDLDDIFFTGLISRLEVMAERDGYDVIVASSRNDPALEKSRLHALLSWRPAGLVAVPCSDAIPDILQTECVRLPIVLADRLPPHGTFADSVLIDNAAAGALAARHLIETGHDNILIAASDLSIWPIRERVRGVSETIAAMGGPAPQVLEIGSSADRGADCFADWMGVNAAPAAIFGLTNVATLAVLSGLARRRVNVPDECSLIGFDDYAWMSARMTPLTAIRQPLDDMAQAVWDRLTLRMAGDGEPPCQTVLSADLQVRDSVRGCRPESRAAADLQERGTS